MVQYYGMDGLGDVPNTYPEASHVKREPDSGFAAVKLADAAAAHSGLLTVVALGPLTNVAMACLLDPLFASNVRTLYVMGGAEGQGNVPAAPPSEYNFYGDAEAASVVLESGVNMVRIE